MTSVIFTSTQAMHGPGSAFSSITVIVVCNDLYLMLYMHVLHKALNTKSIYSVEPYLSVPIGGLKSYVHA